MDDPTPAVDSPSRAVPDDAVDVALAQSGDTQAFERLYRAHEVPDVRELMAALQFIGRQVFIISGGLALAVIPFGESLGVPRQHVRAVDVVFNRLAGRWWDYQLDREGFNPDEQYLDHEAGPLSETHGKAEIVRELRQGRPGQALLVGDGVSDLMARPAADLLVGFGGVVRRARVAAEADVYIECGSLAPVLPLVASPSDCRLCAQAGHARLLQKGLDLIRQGAVHFRDATMRDQILAAYLE